MPADSPVVEDPAVSARRMADLIGGYQASAAIGAFVRVGAADALAEGPATSAELATRIGADEAALSRLLEATLAMGLFTVTDDGCYSLTALGQLLRGDVPGSMRRYAIVATEEWRWYAYGHLDQTLRTGEPGFVAAHGSRLWDYLPGHPEARASFEGSLARIGASRDQVIASSVDFSRLRCLVDVGGGQGGLLRAVLPANPQLRGILFDLPDVVERGRETLQAAGLAERCEAIAGDFREGVPVGGDCYVLSWILHDWDDGTAQTILRRCREAMVKGASVLVVPESGQPEAEALRQLVRQADLEMLAVVGGRERTAAEFRRLLTGAGFSVAGISPLPGGLPFSVIEGVVE
jgi:hypothetical protein